jgi:hypothetical protein
VSFYWARLKNFESVRYVHHISLCVRPYKAAGRMFMKFDALVCGKICRQSLNLIKVL